MSRGQYQPMPSQWTEVSKMLALEVKDIMTEVSKLKEERARIQQEIADLITMRSKITAGFPPDMWGFLQAGTSIAAPPPEAPAPPADQEVAVVAARPAWRTIEQRPSGPKKKGRGMAKEQPAPPPPPPPVEPPKPSWANWRPNPVYQTMVQPPSAPPKAAPPKSIGLFGEE